jgi:LacI family transcriptional regulator
MNDVAAAAGVSIKTVSRVINGQPNVRADVKRRVEEAIAALNYHPNVFARGLVRQRSHLIGLVYENPSPSYVVELQRGVLHGLEDSSYRLVVMPVGSVATHAGDIVTRLRAAALDGVVLAPPAGDHPGVLRDLANAGIACARIAPTRMLEATPAITIDDTVAAEAIADHLLALGHRRIGIIAGDPNHASSHARMEGYRRALDRGDVRIRECDVATGYYTRAGGEEAGRTLLGRADGLTALLVQNDDMAVGVLGIARDMGLRLPEQLSIVGFDDSEAASICWPRLTTVRQPVFAMAATAATMVIAQLEDMPVGSSIGYRHEIVIRESTAAPASA